MAFPKGRSKRSFALFYRTEDARENRQSGGGTGLGPGYYGTGGPASTAAQSKQPMRPVADWTLSCGY